MCGCFWAHVHGLLRCGVRLAPWPALIERRRDLIDAALVSPEYEAEPTKSLVVGIGKERKRAQALPVGSTLRPRDSRAAMAPSTSVASCSTSVRNSTVMADFPSITAQCRRATA